MVLHRMVSGKHSEDQITIAQTEFRPGANAAFGVGTKHFHVEPVGDHLPALWTVSHQLMDALSFLGIDDDRTWDTGDSPQKLRDESGHRRSFARIEFRATDV